MRGAKIFGIRITLAACVLALLLAGEAGFISVAWAGKPDHARRTRTEYGYAMFRDGATDAIRSDGRDSNDDSIVDPYVDCNIGGEDLVKIVLYDDNTLKYVEVYFGKMTYHYPDFDASSRRVHFWFDIDDAQMLEGYYMGHEAVYDILVSETPSGTRRGNPANDAYYLNDGCIHFPIKVYADGSVDWVQFAVDRGYQGSEDDGAITQDAVDNFYKDPADNIDYWDTSTYEPEPGQIIYSLDYVNGFDVTRVHGGEDGELDTWIFTTRLPPVNLFVEEYIYSSKGKSGKERRVGKETVYLAEYSELPFEIAVSLDPLTEYPVQSSQAPRRHNTLSTLWGKIKVR